MKVMLINSWFLKVRSVLATCWAMTVLTLLLTWAGYDEIMLSLARAGRSFGSCVKGILSWWSIRSAWLQSPVWLVVNHDGLGGTASDIMVWDNGSILESRIQSLSVTVGLVTLPALPSPPPPPWCLEAGSWAVSSRVVCGREGGGWVRKVPYHGWWEDFRPSGGSRSLGFGRPVGSGFSIVGFLLVALAGWLRAVAFLVRESGRARTVARLIAGVRGGALSGAAWGKGNFGGAKAKVGWLGPAGRAFRVKVVLELG